MKTPFKLFFCLLLPFIFSSCEKKNIDKSSQININITAEPNTLDPRRARSLNDSNVIKLYMEGLTRIGLDQKPTLALCESYEVSKDLKTYTFKLRDAIWSDGNAITAKNFIDSWKKSLSPTFPSAQANLLYVIKNAKKVKQGLLPPNLLGAKAIDKKTLQIRLEYEAPYLLELLSYPCFFPIPSHIDKSNQNWSQNSESYICSGPFLLKQWKHSDSMVAEKNPSYWDVKNVNLHRINLSMIDSQTGLNMFENNELDWEGSPLSTLSADALQSLKRLGKLYTQSLSGTSFLRLNTDQHLFKSLNVRKALLLSLNRQDIAQSIFNGLAETATTLVPKDFHLQETPLFKDADLIKAKDYLKKAIDNQEISSSDLNNITLSYISRERSHKLAQLIQDQWRQALNIKVSLRPVELKVFFDLVRKQNYQIAISSWEADFNDPINFLEVFKSKTTATNNTGWENTLYQNYLDKSNFSRLAQERKALLKASEKILIENAPIIPLVHYQMAFVKNPKIKNVVVSSTGGIDFKWCFLDKEIK